MKLLFRYFFIIITLSSFIFPSDFSIDKVSEYRGSYKTKHISVRTFEKSIDKIYKEINQKNIFNANNCNLYISKITDFLLLRGGKEYLPLTESDQKILQKRAYIIVNKLFSLRLLLGDKLKKFHQQGKISNACVDKIRKAFRYSRFLEEFITEIGVNMPNKKPITADHLDFSQQKYQFYLNPKYKSFHVKSGDILLIRASSFVSAVVARIGDEEGQFSHSAMIHVDDKGEAKVMEALIQKGVIITPYKEWRENNHHTRALIFRHDNEKLAKKAAQKLYDTIQMRWAAKNFMLYDFQMDNSDTKQFFCSELVQYAFRLAGNHTIPTFRTSFKAFRNHSFLNELTIGVDEAFAPSDLEVEPRINLVAEWRNYDATRDARIDDVIQTKILYWMSHKNYYLKETFRSFFGTTIGLLGRKLFGLKSDQIPPNMPYGFMKNIIKLNDLNKILRKYLLGLEDKYFKKYGHSMDYLRMMKQMEKFRVEDCESYIKRKKEMKQKLHDVETLSEPYVSPKPIFHDLFNTKNELDCNL